MHHDVPAENSLMLEVLDIACLTLNLHVNVFAQVFLGVRAMRLSASTHLHTYHRSRTCLSGVRGLHLKTRPPRVMSHDVCSLTSERLFGGTLAPAS